VLEETEARISLKVLDVLGACGTKVVESDNVDAVAAKTIAQVGPKNPARPPRGLSRCLCSLVPAHAVVLKALGPQALWIIGVSAIEHDLASHARHAEPADQKAYCLVEDRVRLPAPSPTSI